MWKAERWQVFLGYSDTAQRHPASKRRIHNQVQPTMDINDLFDGKMKSINLFADEFTKLRLQETG